MAMNGGIHVTTGARPRPRTATVWRSLNPFWGEEYTLHLPNGFHTLSVYVYDQDTLSGDDLIGRVSLSKDTLNGAPKGIENWMRLETVQNEREIQGELHLEVGRWTSSTRDFLRIKVIEARDLAPKDMMGSSDPYVRVTFMDSCKQTGVRRGSRFPEWHETLEFDIPSCMSKAQDDPDETMVVVSLWDWDRVGSDDFMGKVIFKLNEITPNQTFDQWFWIQPKEHKPHSNGSNDSTVSPTRGSEDLGTIRVRVRLSEERILPTQYYQPLIGLLMDSVSAEKHKMSGPTPLKMLQEVMSMDLMEVANTLVKLYLGQGKISAYLDVICREEIETTNNPNTLFRGNSLATKSMDQFMKIVGMPYLHETLGSIVTEVHEDHRLVELDPGRLELLRHTRRPSLKTIPRDKDVIEQSTTTLLRYLTAIKDSILCSVSRMPPIMRIIFKRFRERIEEKWPGPEHEDHKYVGISGFLFLRFFAPAVLSPKLFALQESHPDARTSRTLTLLAKAVQNMGNLGLQLGLGKEQWMTPLHPFIKSCVQDVKNFIDEICQIEDIQVVFDASRRRSVFHPSVTIKQGFLGKRRGNKIRFLSPFTFKKRYFWLKYDMLSYAKKPTDQVRNHIPITQIIGVERVDKQAFSRPNMGQVLSRTSHGTLEILYFQAKDLNDMYSWISSIRKTIITNEGLLDTHHPGACRGERWTCCSRLGQSAPGCSPSHSRVTIGDWRDPLDPDAEAQTIYSQLWHGRHILKQKYVESQEAVRETMEETVKVIQMEKQQRRSVKPRQQRGSLTINTEDHMCQLSPQVSPSQLSPSQLSPLSQLSPSQLSPIQLSPTHLSPSFSPSFLQPPPSPVFLGMTHDISGNLTLHKSMSFQDATIASVAQLLDVITDLEKAHEAYAQIEREKARNSLRGDGS